MTNRLSVNVVSVISMGLICVLGTRCLVEGLPATGGIHEEDHSDIIASRIEVFKQDILGRLGYKRVPDLTNVTQSIEEKRRMIQQYRRYMEERELSTRSQEDSEDEDETNVKSRTFYNSQYQAILRIITTEQNSGKVILKPVQTYATKMAIFPDKIYNFCIGDRPRRVSVKDWNVGNTFRLYFNTQLNHPGDPTYELHVDSAKIKVFINKVRPENLDDKFSVEKQIRVNIYQLVLISSTSNYKRKLLDSKIVNLEHVSWQSFEIAKAVQDWIDNPQTNLGLEIATDSQNIKDVIDISLENRVNANESNTGSNDTITVPNIDIYAQERSILKRVKRRGRRRGDCRKGDGEKRCCRHPIQIHFKDIGWDDWILAPMEYRGYYCGGTCPYRYKVANTFSGIKALLHLNTLNTKKEVPSPCCVATKLSPFTILHYDMEGRYTFSDYPDLVVEQCKCG